ncbi:4-hydroxy-tetrahydrodipicolinate synthase [Streptomyces sp. NPDC048623]|uniref:4-hydroxy-tetrahydrodipicolinate synthase family protein n=1 Tax=Streptomyces sp. NPDC048623 TaxID=3155761 RepID=UPI003441B2BC
MAHAYVQEQADVQAREFTPHGIYVPLVTPFGIDGRPDLDALEALAHSVLDAGAAGLVALGTTGEVGALDPEERTAVIDTCARVCRRRGVPLIVGAGGGATETAARELAELGGRPEISAALVIVPAFVRPSPEGVLAHFRRLAAASAVPLIVYHIPYRTGRPLDAATLRALGTLPGVVGIKHAVGGVDQDTVSLLGDLPDGFAVLAGDDTFLSPLLALGAAGGILASAHLATARFTALAEAWHDGDVARARPLGHRLARLSTLLFAEPNPSVVKAVLHAQGRIPTPDVRLPLLPASEASVAAALKALAELEESAEPEEPAGLEEPAEPEESAEAVATAAV